MELYIQMGHGMQSICEELSKFWGHSTTIISPQNIKETSLQAFSSKMYKANGKVLFDPQLYFPRKHQKNRIKYSYWPQSEITLIENGQQCNDLMGSLANINRLIGAESFILPAEMTVAVDRKWDAIQKSFINCANGHKGSLKLLQTLALAKEVLLDERQIEGIVQYAEEWPVDGFYITGQHPDGYYLVDNPVWMANLLALVSGLKRQRKKVIVGYASHQMLCLALAKCDAIASGNFLNVRWFKPEHFETKDEESISRRATWFYCPQALSEFKIPYLDIAKRVDVLDRISPSSEMMSPYCEMLFSGAIPSSTGFSESHAHKHYLNCLQKQVSLASRISYNETCNAHLLLLDTAEQLLKGLREKDIRGQDRDFIEILDTNRAAISAHNATYKTVLTMEWNQL